MMRARTGIGATVWGDPLNICVLYAERYTGIKTVYEHLNAFRRYSRHNFFYLPGSDVLPASDAILESAFDLEIFDAVIVHYSIRHCVVGYFHEVLARKLAAYSGLKIAFIQDEYDLTENTRRLFERINYDIVYTCVPDEGREFVYPAARFPRTTFLPTLTGYVPEDPDIESAARPMAAREIVIAYRGRVLHPVYGQLGREKWVIGTEMKRLAAARGVRVDIEVDEDHRIYGGDWYRFLGSARATLGSESGANVFDIDGSLRAAVDAALAARPDIPFEALHRDILAPHDGRVRMNQVSPKIFEAMRLRTALVLFEGAYSGVAVPERHFITLKKDFSNADEVFAKLADVPYLEALTECAYEECIASGRYSYRSFVQGVERDIEERLPGSPRGVIFATPIAVRAGAGTARFLAGTQPIGSALSSGILVDELQREQLVTAVTAQLRALQPLLEAPAAQPLAVPPVVGPTTRKIRIVRGAWRILPMGVRVRARQEMRRLAERSTLPENNRTFFERVLQAVWRRALPQSVRRKLLTLIRG